AVRPNEQVPLCTEVMAEARRNPEIARISSSFDADVKKWILDLLGAAADRGDIPRDVDLEAVVTMLMIIADGVWWRRALDPDFDPASVVPIFMDITRHMLRARPAGKGMDITRDMLRARPAGKGMAITRQVLRAAPRAKVTR